MSWRRRFPLFRAAINAGDRVDGALKDMAIMMSQQNRGEEAIEAIDVQIKPKSLLTIFCRISTR